MSRFLLTAQLELRAPTNTRQVMNNLRSQLAGVNVPVQMKGVAEAQKQLKNVAKQANVATNAAQNMGKSFGLAFKRFAAFTVASRAVSLFTNGLANAVDEAIDFQREMVKISQVTGQAVEQLKGLEQTISSLSKTLGVNSKELLSTARILAQTGLRAQELEVALEALAKTTLAPTFDDITKTAEGAVAILAQFGGGVGKLEQQLGAINAVAGKFAVESGDLIGAIRRVGGVFVEAGGSLEDLLGLFTSIRATTRESSESIATGLRTIFTRIQRPRTIEFLKQFGVELETVDGRFVGAFEAVRRLNQAIGGLDQGDITFVRIAEEIAGFRQIGKVIPLLKQFELAERSRQAAIEGGDSLTKDAAAAQQALAVQIVKVKEEFMALVRGIANTTAFQVMVKGSLALASALIKIGEAIKPIIPLLGALAAFKFAKGLGSFAAGFGASLRGVTGKNQGGKILGFNRGGYVPGTGNRDTVPAMLQPGEFVIKASSAKKLGPQALHSMNNNRFKGGGTVLLNMKPNKVGGLFLQPDAEDRNITATTGTEFEKKDKSGIVALLKDKKAGLRTSRTKGDDGKPLTEAQARSQIKMTKATKDKPSVPQGDFAIFAGRALGLPKNASSNAIKDAWKENTGKHQAIKDSFVSSLQGGQLIGGENGLVDMADKIKLRIAKGAMQAYIASTEDLNSGLSDEVTNAASAGFRAMTRRIVNSKSLTNNVGPKKMSVGKRAKGNIKSTVEQLFRDDENKENSARTAIEGYILEAVIGSISGVLPESGEATFDFLNLGRGDAEGWGDLFGPAAGPAIAKLLAADAKRSANATNYNSIRDKTKTWLAGQSKGSDLADLVNIDVTRANKGGSIGGQGDTVPALLTPGEFVINKESARSIGYGNLNSMNKNGVARFNKGGFVGWKRYNQGGQASGGMMGNLNMFALFSAGISFAGTSLQEMTKNADGTSTALSRLIDYTQSVGVTLLSVKLALETFGIAVTAKNIKNFFGTGPQSLGGILKNGAGILKGGLKSLQEGFKGAQFGSVTRGGKQIDVFRRKGKFAKASGSTAAGFEGQTQQVMKKLTNFGNQFNKALKTAKDGITKGFSKAGGSQIKEGLGDIFKGFQGGLSTAGQKISGIFSTLGAAASPLTKAFQQNAQKAVLLAATYTPAIAAIITNTKAVIGNTLARAKESLGGFGKRIKESRLGQSIGRGRDRLSSGIGRGRDAIGRGFTKFKGTKIGGGLGKIGKGIGGLARAGVGLFSGGGAAAAGGTAAAAGGTAAATGGLAAAGAAVASIAGPALAVAGVLAIVSGGLSAMIDAQGKYEEAVRNGTEAEAQKYNVMKNVPGLVAVFGEGVSRAYQGFKSFLGGDSLAKLDAQAAVATKVAQFDKKKADMARKAADALKDLKDGTGTASEALVAVSASFAKQAEIAEAERNLADATRAEQSTGLGAVGRNIITFGGIFGESAGEKNRRLNKEADELQQGSDEKLAQAFESLRSSTAPLQKKFIISGQSFDEFLDASGLAGKLLPDQIDRLKKDYEVQQKAIETNIKFIESLNFGLRDAAGAAQAMAVTMDGIAQSQEAGFNSFAQSATVLETAMTAAGKNISGAQLDQAIGNLESSMRSFGASEDDINKATGTVKGVQQAQANTDNALEAAKKALIEGDAQTSDKAIKDALGTELLKGVEGPAREQLKLAIEKLKIDETMHEQIRGGDLSGVLAQTLDPVSDAVTKQAIDLAKKRADIENKIIDATRKRQQAELQFISAQKKAIDTQLEAAKVFEDFGGTKLSTDQQLQARRGQANLDLQNAGIAGLTGGGAGDIRRAAADIERNFRGQQDAVNFGTLGMARNATAGGQPIGPAFAGAQGVEDDKRSELKQANQALLDFTKNRISLLKEELDIVRKKNEAEKKSLESLLSGDIEGFLQGQAAAAAGAALRTGDAGLASSFGASALGAGFATLEGQGLSDRQMQRAASLSLSSVGVSDPRAAGVLAGTTAEEERLKSEGRELAGVMGDLGQQTADMAQMEVNAANVVLTAQKLQLEGGAAQGLAAGGMVYASRGMFIPRGTDTVPAMLTPGEFVVNRSAVQRGNNLAILRSMNGGMGAPGGGMGMARGGMVYMAKGGLLSKIFEAHKNAGSMLMKAGGFALNNASPIGMASKALGGGDLTDMISKAVGPLGDTMQSQIDQLKDVFENSPLGAVMQQFSDGANKLVDSALSLKVDPTNVNVNFGGLSFLEMLREEAVASLMEQVQEQISSTKINEVGDTVQRRSGLS